MSYESGARTFVAIGMLAEDALEVFLRRCELERIPRRWKGGCAGSRKGEVEVYVPVLLQQAGARIMTEVMLAWQIVQEALHGCTIPWKDRRAVDVDPKTGRFVEAAWLAHGGPKKPTPAMLEEQMGQRILQQAWRYLGGRTLAAAGATTRAWDPDRAEMRRVSGDATCGLCRRKFRSHPRAGFVLDNEGQPFLRIGCDGDLLKL